MKLKLLFLLIILGISDGYSQFVTVDSTYNLSVPIIRAKRLSLNPVIRNDGYGSGVSGQLKYSGGHIYLFNGTSWVLVADGSSGGSFDTTRVVYNDKSNTYSANTTQSMDTAKIKSGTVFNRVSIRNGQNLQWTLDTATQRSITAEILGTVSLTSPIKLGNATVLEGERASLTSQLVTSVSPDTLTYYPRGILDFSSTATDGIVSPDTSTWRAQTALLKELTLKGSGYKNGKSGIHLSLSDNGLTGLLSLKHIFVESFTYGFNGGGKSNNVDIQDGHFQKFYVGVDSINQSSSFTRNDFWNADSIGYSVGLRILGNQNDVTRNYFELGNGTNMDTIGTGLWFSASSYTNIAGFNKFSAGYTRALIDSGSSNAFVGNIFQNFARTSRRAVSLYGSSASYMGGTIYSFTSPLTDNAFLIGGNYNSIGGVTVNKLSTSGKSPFYISGSYNNLFGFTANQCTGDTADVFIASGATENIVSGKMPNGFIDNGTRSMINGRSKNWGNPGSTGQWNGQTATAFKNNTIIENTTSSPSQFFIADSGGNWVRLDSYWSRSNATVTPTVSTDTVVAKTLQIGAFAYFTGSQPSLFTYTNDGNDNRFLQFYAGGASSQTRGASITLYGNQVAAADSHNVVIKTGAENGYNGQIKFQTNSTNRLVIDGATGGVQVGSAGNYIKSIVTGSLVYNCGSIGAQTDSTFNITVTGATLSSGVQVNESVAPDAGTMVTAYCATAGTVTVKIANFSSGAIDPASKTYYVIVTNF